MTSKGSVAVNFKIVGLLPDSDNWVMLSLRGVAVYTGGASCEIEGGGGGGFRSNEQGHIRGTVNYMLDVTGARLSLLSVTYTNLSVEIYRMEVSKEVRGTYTRNFWVQPSTSRHRRRHGQQLAHVAREEDEFHWIAEANATLAVTGRDSIQVG